jgi:hypothetical protein
MACLIECKDFAKHSKKMGKIAQTAKLQSNQ